MIQRIGGWKTASMFRRYDIVDERDLLDAGERLTAFLATATHGIPIVAPLGVAKRAKHPTRTKPGQSPIRRSRADSTCRRKCPSFLTAEEGNRTPPKPQKSLGILRS